MRVEFFEIAARSVSDRFLHSNRPPYFSLKMKRNALLIAGLLVFILSFSSTVWGIPAYRPDIWLKVGGNYTIRVSGIFYSRTFFKIDILRVKGGYDQPSLLVVSHCLTPEYQENSKSIFLRMKQPPPELAAIYEDFEERRNAVEEEYRVEYEKRRQEIGARELELTGYGELNDSMKFFHDRQQSFWEELRQIQEDTLPEMQQQDWTYYIIDKAAETVSGPLSERLFWHQRRWAERKFTGNPLLKPVRSIPEA